MDNGEVVSFDALNDTYPTATDLDETAPAVVMMPVADDWTANFTWNQAQNDTGDALDFFTDPAMDGAVDELLQHFDDFNSMDGAPAIPVAPTDVLVQAQRSEARRVGKGCVRTWRY